jgi:methyl-accepting chemotaxis protein
MGISRHPLTGKLPQWSNIPIDKAAAERLRSSYDALLTDGSRLTTIFYAKLFERYPGVRPLFPADIRAQEAKLMDSLRAVVRHVESPDALREELKAMGARHVKYGAKPEHYPLVCDLLLECMGDVAGGQWTQQLASEWQQALQIVSDVMLQGASAASQTPPPTRS